MSRSFHDRHPLIALVDESVRATARLRSVFADTRRGIGLGESELMVLNAVVEADRPPTVAQIGRSLGRPRQLIQRAANALADAGMIALSANPDHKRAPLLRPTDQGRALKARADTLADAIATQLGASLDLDHIASVARAMALVRKDLEKHMRTADFT